VPSNWAEGAIPIATDDVRITGNTSIIYGLNQAGVALGDLKVENYGGTIGSASSPLILDPDDMVIDTPSGQIFLLVGSTATTRILRTGQASPAGLVLCAVGTLTTVECKGGSTHIGVFWDGDTTIGTLHLSPGASATVGPNVALTTWRQTGGTGDLSQNDVSGWTTISVMDGTLRTRGAVPCATMTINGGKVIYDATGTVTTAVLNGGHLDCNNTHLARTFTTLTQDQAATFDYDTTYITVTTYNRNGPMRQQGFATLNNSTATARRR
jgi:hypothetical protein